MSTEQFTILLLRVFLRNEKLPSELNECDLSEVFDFAARHKIENIVLAAIKYAKVPIADDLLKRWEDVCDENTVQLMFQENEKERLIDAFNKAQIAFIPLKGWYLRGVYPQKEYRFMSDLDILVHRSDREAVSLILKELGYIGGIGDYGKDDGYTLPPFIHIEIHLDLFSIENEKRYEYYKTIWDKAILVEGYQYKLSWNDSYIHLIMNYLKDYISKGTGIRPIIDFYYFLDKYRDELDFDYINSEFEKLGVLDLAQQTIHLVIDWFGENKNISSSEMGNKLLHGYLYGTSEELVQHRFDDLSSNVNGENAKKIVYLIKRAFPGMKIMKYKYPILEKIPILLPFCWCARLVRHTDRISMEMQTVRRIK